MASPAPDPADNPILTLIAELLRIANESPERSASEPPPDTPEQQLIAAARAAKQAGIEYTQFVETPPE